MIPANDRDLSDTQRRSLMISSPSHNAARIDEADLGKIDAPFLTVSCGSCVQVHR